MKAGTQEISVRRQPPTPNASASQGAPWLQQCSRLAQSRHSWFLIFRVPNPILRSFLIVTCFLSFFPAYDPVSFPSLLFSWLGFFLSISLVCSGHGCLYEGRR